MRISYRTVAHLPRGYSITLLPDASTNKLPSFLAGSEGDSELLLFEAPDYSPRVIASTPGGFISLAPLMGDGRRHVVASTLFKPGFNAAESAILLYALDDEARREPSLIAKLPFTHRVATRRLAGRDYVLASTLCAAKDHKDDWTQPGGIHLAMAPQDLRQPWTVRPIVTGLTKNHGFDFAVIGKDHRPGYLISAMEGLIFMPLPANGEGNWATEIIDHSEHSDAFAFDWDGDDEPEIFSISPFHGNVLSLHKKSALGWKRTVIHDDLAFGHIVWAGSFLGRPGLLAGSRRERRELRLYRPAPDGSVDPNYEIIDEGIGPSQLVVLSFGAGRELLFMAAHGQDEIRIYDVTV